MTTLSGKFLKPLTSEAADERFGELACHAASLAILVLGFVGVGRMAESLAEVLLGTLATLGLSVQLVILGMVANLRRRLERPAPKPE